MSTTSPHTQDFREQPAIGAEPTERGASPWLWALLILALVALPAWWWIRNSQQTFTTPVTPTSDSTAATAQPLPEATNQRPATMVRHEATPKAAAVIRNREARPLASNPVPVYPARALRSGVEGSVTARLQVDASGRVSDAEIVDRTGARDRDLDRAVLNTVRDWRFEPAIRNGRAVATTVQLPVDFHTAQQ